MQSLLKKIRVIDGRGNIDNLKLELYGTLIPYLFSTEIFSNNIEIKEFIDKLKLSRTVKDYVYSSRPQIVARIAREIHIASKDTLLENLSILKEDASKYNEQNNIEMVAKGKKKDIVDILDKYSRNK